MYTTILATDKKTGKLIDVLTTERDDTAIQKFYNTHKNNKVIFLGQASKIDCFGYSDDDSDEWDALLPVVYDYNIDMNDIIKYMNGNIHKGIEYVGDITLEEIQEMELPIYYFDGDDIETEI